MKKKILAVAAAALILVGASVGYAALPVGNEKQVESMAIDTTDGALRVGIISDSQLGQDPIFQNHLETSLTFLKNQEVNMILNVGDYTDTALKKNFEGYPAAFDKVYGENKPLTQSIMGNHDYWLPGFFDCWQIPFTGTMQRRFMKNTGASSPWTHKVVNGYHFIAASPTNGGMGEEAYTKKIQWIKEQIELAVKDDPAKPIFVLTHNNPQDTVYMSKEDGCKNLDELFSQYPQVVSLSGHSHASLMDEQSIYQKNYTALNTQCLSYVCFAAGDTDVVQENGEFLDQVPMAMIMTIQDNSVTFDRYDMTTQTKAADPWILPIPVTKDSFSYTDDIRTPGTPAPAWPENFTYNVTTGTDADGKQTNVIAFTAATHPQALRYYEVQFINAQGETVAFPQADAGKEPKTTLRFMSDYARPPAQRAEIASFPIPEAYAKSLPAGSYTVKVQANSAFGSPSETKTLEITLS